jgi:hypothetical protein
MLADFVDFVD